MTWYPVSWEEILRAAHFVAGLYPDGISTMTLSDALADELRDSGGSLPGYFPTPEKRSQELVRLAGVIADRIRGEREGHVYSTSEVRDLLDRGAYWRYGRDHEGILDLQWALTELPWHHWIRLRRIAAGAEDDVDYGDAPEAVTALARLMNRYRKEQTRDERDR